MSATKLADEGLAALEARKYDDAIEKLSKAIDTSKSPAWLLARSTAYMETRQLDKALRDAEYAYCTATERGNDKSRKQMIEAQHRRSVIYFRQKRYADADACAVWSQQLAKGVAVRSADAAAEYVDEKGLYHVTAAQIVPPEEKEKAKAKGAQGGDALARINSIMSKTDSKTPYEKDWQKAQTWRYSIVRFLEALPADDPARKLTAKLVPAKPSLEDKVERKEKEEHDPEIEAAKAELAQEKPASKPEVSNGPLRSQIYQTDSQITVTLFMKFANKEATEKVKVDFQPNMVSSSRSTDGSQFEVVLTLGPDCHYWRSTRASHRIRHTIRRHRPLPIQLPRRDHEDRTEAGESDPGQMAHFWRRAAHQTGGLHPVRTNYIHKHCPCRRTHLQETRKQSPCLPNEFQDGAQGLGQIQLR